jgi:hypothetical protein
MESYVGMWSTQKSSTPWNRGQWQWTLDGDSGTGSDTVARKLTMNLDI